MTFLELKQDCYRRLGFAASPDSTVATRIGAFLNDAHRQILSDPDLSGLRRGQLTFPSVASQVTYGLTPGFSRVYAVTERTNDRRLAQMSLDDQRLFDPALRASGDPTHYIPLGRVAVAIQPSDASELFFDSTSASDTQVAYVEGFTSGGYRRTANVTLTGTTAVSLSAAITDWVMVTDVYLASAAVGVVTLLEDSGTGAELARIGVGQMRTRYQGIQLWPTPSQVITYYVDVDYEIGDMSNDTDEPLLPLDFHDLIAIGARIREYEKTDDLKRLQLARQEYQDRRRALRYWAIASPDYRPVPGMAGRYGYSPLGGFYPSERWP